MKRNSNFNLIKKNNFNWQKKLKIFVKPAVINNVIITRMSLPQT